MSLTGYITNCKHFLKPFFFRTVAECGIRQAFVGFNGDGRLEQPSPDVFERHPTFRAFRSSGILRQPASCPSWLILRFEGKRRGLRKKNGIAGKRRFGRFLPYVRYEPRHRAGVATTTKNLLPKLPLLCARCASPHLISPKCVLPPTVLPRFSFYGLTSNTVPQP
jgi:hypothetical protein